jgi:hypothetical protein
MQNSVHPELASPLAVVAHDAGAANLIIGWLRMRRDLDIRTCLAGPAVELWAAVFGKPRSATLDEVLTGAQMLISGTSYASELEHQARVLAKARGIRSIGVIDHWVNYSDRFVHGGSCVLPDEIWVTDEYALSIATACFPGIAVLQKLNHYLADLVEQVRAVNTQPSSSESQRVLYVLEPIRHPWAKGAEAGEFQALDYFLGKFPSLGLDKNTMVHLRPHPSDPVGKYREWMLYKSGWNLKLDPNLSLADSIAWANIVVGCETYAMVVALAVGRRVISTLPPHAPLCRLPMKDILHLRDLPAVNLYKLGL